MFSWENGGWIRVKYFSSNIIIGESIGVSMWELNKVHDMGMQFMGDTLLQKLKFMTHHSLALS